MAFNIFLIVSSWLVVFLIKRKSIFTKWLLPLKKRGGEFLKGFLFTAILCSLTLVSLSFIGHVKWSIASDISFKGILKSIFYDINSVVFEELIFRGVMLLLLIHFTNRRAGILISAIAFGIYHWFTFGVWANFIPMAVVFLTTGLMGYALAMAYSKTQSIILPIALHLGWNVINNTVFSKGPNAIQLLVPSEVPELSGLYGITSLIFYLIIPLIILLFVNSKFIEKDKSSGLLM